MSDDTGTPGPGDARDHLLAAAHELLTAMRALIDAADELVEQQRKPRDDREPRLRTIDVE